MRQNDLAHVALAHYEKGMESPNIPRSDWDLASGVEGLGGVAPVERLDQLGRRDGVHFDFGAEWQLPGCGGRF